MHSEFRHYPILAAKIPAAARDRRLSRAPRTELDADAAALILRSLYWKVLDSCHV